MRLTFTGYVILRLSSAFLWLRAGKANPDYRSAAFQNAAGLILLQIVWAAIVFLPTPGSALSYSLFLLGVLGELSLVWYTESKNPRSWHRHHIIERFGLLNIIVLGELLLSSTEAFESAYHAGFTPSFIIIALCGAVLTFSMWWLYFTEEDHLPSMEVKRALEWGYGHFLVFAAGAAVGAGIGVVLDAAQNTTDIQHGFNTTGITGLFISIPIALYILGLWFVRDRHAIQSSHGWILLTFAGAIALSGLLPHAHVLTSVLLLVCLVVRLRSSKKSDQND